MKLDELGEFGLIGQIERQFAGLVPDGVKGIGDDCAVVPLTGGRSLLVTTDMLVEDVHFLTSHISAYDLGRKSLTVNVSDISAMGAEPYAAFLGIALPVATDTRWVEDFMTGFRSHGIPLLGGDTTRSAVGIAVSVTVIAFSDDTNIKYRSSAKPGDRIMVSGTLGDSAGGLKAILCKVAPDEDVRKLIATHHAPLSYVKSGKWFGNQKAVHAMLDISDGLASDLGHILKASEVGARVDIESLPISESLVKVSADNAWNITSLAIEGGEDYVLLLTVDPASSEALKQNYLERFDTPLYEIGEITSEPGIEWLRGGEPIHTAFKGFDHF